MRFLRPPSETFRSLIAHEARSPPPRQPALARHSPHLTSHRNSRPTHPRTALLPSPPAQHAPRSRLPCPAQPTASSHCGHPNSICPAYPPSASHDPSPTLEPASRPKSPLAIPWICPAPSLLTPRPAYQLVRYLSGSQHLCPGCGHDCSAQATAIRTRPATLHEAAGTSPSASARAQAILCRDVLDARASHMLAAEQQQTSADTCSASCVGTSALQHTCIAGTHALQHTLGQMHVVLWTCTHTCKSGDGMDTVL